jgi:MFS family permease
MGDASIDVARGGSKGAGGKTGLLLRATLLLGAFGVQADQMAITPNLETMSMDFPGVSFPLISMVATVSTIFIGVGSLACGKLIGRYGKKRTLLGGTLLFSIGGAAGGLIPSLSYVMVTRTFEGLGAGVVLTLCPILVATLMENRKQVNLMLGLNGAMVALFGVLISLLAGALGVVSWRYAFFIYLFGLVTFAFQATVLPDDARQGGQGGHAQHAAHPPPDNTPPPPPEPIPGAAVFLGVSAFLFSVIASMFFLSMSSLVFELEAGASAQAGVCFSIITASSFVAGLVFAKLFEWSQGFLPCIAYAFMAVGAILPAVLPSLASIFAGAAVFGFGYGIFYPYLYGRAAQISTEGTLERVMSLLNCFYFVGMFASSFAIGLIGAAAGTASAVFYYQFMSVAFVVFLLVYLFTGVYGRKKGKGRDEAAGLTRRSVKASGNKQ